MLYKNAGIILLDAHPHLENNNDLILYLLEKKIIKKENIIMLGIRCWSKSEFSFLKQSKIKYYPMKEIAEETLNEVIETVMNVAKNFDALYISIDIDVLDPAFVDAKYPEPAGLTPRELIFIIHKLKNLKNIKMFDLTEIKEDADEKTLSLCAKILGEIC